MRLDVALFELRLFRSRSQAQAAIAAGRVVVNGEAAKPSREIHAGDLVTFEGAGSKRTVQVLELPHRSLSRDAARALIYEVED